MFARIVAIALLVAGIGFTSPAWADPANPAGTNATNPNPNANTGAANEEGPPPVGVSPNGQATPGTATTAPQTTPTGQQTPTDKIVNAFMQLDTDNSGSVSFDEYMTMVQQRAKDRFDAMDTNHDGQVSPDEYRAFWQQREAMWYRLRH